MSPSPVITWFEIPTQDFNRAIAFYEAAFEIKLQQEEMDGIANAIFPHQEGQAAGALVNGSPYKPSENGVMIYLFTEQFDPTLDRIQANGGKVVMPKTKIPPGFIAMFIDSEGNRVGLHSLA